VIVFWPPSVFKCTDFLIFFERVLCSVTPGGGASLAVDPPGHLQEAGHFFEGGGAFQPTSLRHTSDTPVCNRRPRIALGTDPGFSIRCVKGDGRHFS